MSSNPTGIRHMIRVPVGQPFWRLKIDEWFEGNCVHRSWKLFARANTEDSVSLAEVKEKERSVCSHHGRSPLARVLKQERVLKKEQTDFDESMERHCRKAEEVKRRKTVDKIQNDNQSIRRDRHRSPIVSNVCQRRHEKCEQKEIEKSQRRAAKATARVLNSNPGEPAQRYRKQMKAEQKERGELEKYFMKGLPKFGKEAAKHKKHKCSK